MRIKTLGAHNCESLTTRLTSILIDDTIVIDAGSVTSSLTLAEQRSLKAVIVTHQHYDHIKDLPLLAFNFAMAWAELKVYSTPPVFDALSLLLGSKLYPNFLKFPEENPTVKFHTIEASRTEEIAGYRVLPVPVNHSVFTVGYQITDPDGKTVFYTGDTGPGLKYCWESVSPQLLITEVSAPDRFETLYRARRHFTPKLLKEELLAFREIKGYLPKIVIVHMNPDLEAEIKAELEAAARELDHPITTAYEGMNNTL